MLRLNIRHQLPQIGMNKEWGRYESAAAVPAQVHTNQEQATSNQGATQVSIQIDSYPSRRMYGYRKMDDFTSENGQKGFSDARAATSKKTQNAWARATGGAKRGNDIIQQYKSEMMSKYSARTIIEFNLIPNPQITVTPSRVVGEPDRGNVTAEIQPANGANVKYTPGNLQVYLENEGFIRRWVTEDKYDIYA